MKGIIMTVFYFQQDQIAKTLCENKDQPKLHCNGKCYLNKQLGKEEKKDKGIQKNEKETVTMLMVVSAHPIFKFVPKEEAEKVQSCYLLKQYGSILVSVFRPPCC